MRFVTIISLGLSVALLMCAEFVHSERRVSIQLERDGMDAERCVEIARIYRKLRQHKPQWVLVEDAKQAALRVQVKLSAMRVGWVLRLSVRDAANTDLGRREIRQTEGDCTKVEDAIALAMLLIVSDHPSSMSDTSTRATVNMSVPRKLPVPVSKTVQKSSSKKPKWSVSASGAVMCSIGVVAPVSLGIGAGLLLSRLGRPIVHIDAVFWTPATVPGDVGAVLLYGGVAGVAGALLHWQTKFAAITTWLGVKGGALHGRGIDYSSNYSRVAGLGYFTVVETLSWYFSANFAVTAAPSLWVPLLRPEFLYARADGVLQGIYQVPPAGGSFDLGFQMHF